MRTISILIPTYNAGHQIIDLINGLKRQTLKSIKIEIIIIDSSSNDNTLYIIKEKFPEIRIEVIANKMFDHGGTRNLLSTMASGEFLLFMTQDAIPYDEFLLKNLLEPFNDSKVAISFARQIPKEDAGVIESFMRGFNYPAQGQVKDKNSLNRMGVKTFFNSNVCSMYRKSMFYELEKFPEKIILNEDMVFASKAILKGFKVSYSANAKVLHSHNYSLLQQFKRYFDIGMAFHQTSYLLDFGTNEKEGFKLVLSQWKFLIKQKKFFYIPYTMLETVTKYVGYLLGKKHEFIPQKLKKSFSAYMK
jgi:rhamnosyltransferase